MEEIFTIVIFVEGTLSNNKCRWNICAAFILLGRRSLKKSKSRSYLFFQGTLLCSEQTNWETRFHCKQLFSVSSFQSLTYWEYNTFICQLQKINWYYSVFQRICKIETSTAKQMLCGLCSNPNTRTHVPEKNRILQ